MRFLSSLIFPTLVILAGLNGGPLVFAVTLLFFPISPLLDILFRKSIKPKQTSKNYIGPIVSTLWAVLYPSAVVIASSSAGSLGLFELTGLTLSAGLTGSIAIVAAHDLVHKKESRYKGLGFLILAFVNYMHFGVLHLAGHHRNVGTEDDHSTAWYGESLFAYLFRSIRACYIATWNLEKMRLSRQGIRNISFKNRMIWFQVFPLMILTSLIFFFGWVAGIFFIFQGIIAALMLETVSYIQHYGLKRQPKKGSNKLEPLNESHSWESHGFVTTSLFLNIQVHADHHRRPVKWFNELEPSDIAPKLPESYPTMIILSSIPSLWKLVMHKEIRQHSRGAKKLDEGLIVA